MEHPVSDEKIAIDFPDYMRELAGRLRSGAETYGDGSFSRTGPELCGELSQELLDICGWGFVLWCRIQELEKKLRATEGVLAERLDGALLSSQPSPSHNPLSLPSRLFESLSSKLAKQQLGEP